MRRKKTLETEYFNKIDDDNDWDDEGYFENSENEK